MTAEEFKNQYATGVRKFVGVDLSNADLSHTDLSDADFSNANLSGADFTGATLDNVTVDGANLTGIQLEGVIVNGVKVGSTVIKPKALNISNDVEDADLAWGYWNSPVTMGVFTNDNFHSEYGTETPS